MHDNLLISGQKVISNPSIALDVRHNPTLAENIDQRIAMLSEHIGRLQKVKALLSEPAGILNVPIEDLRFAMNY